MELPRELISNFAKLTASKTQSPSEVITYGIAYKIGENYFVKLDGAADGTLTPVASTVEVSDGERVTVMIKNHTATITGNFSEPAAKNSDVVEAQTNIEEAQSDIEEVQQKKVEKSKVIESVNNSEETEVIKASRLDVADIFAKNITATGNIDFKNDNYALSSSEIVIPIPGGGTVKLHGVYLSSDGFLQLLASGRLIITGQELIAMDSNGSIEIESYDDSVSMKSGKYLSLHGDAGVEITSGGDVTLQYGGTSHKLYASDGGPIKNEIFHAGNLNDYVIDHGSGGGDSSISWKYRKRKSGAVELWGRRAISDRACNTSFGGGMYRTSLIEVANFPFKVYYPNIQVSYEPSNGYGAFVWPYSAATADHPASYYLMRPTIPDANLAGYLNFYVRGSLVE